MFFFFHLNFLFFFLEKCCALDLGFDFLSWKFLWVSNPKFLKNFLSLKFNARNSWAEKRTRLKCESRMKFFVVKIS